MKVIPAIGTSRCVTSWREREVVNGVPPTRVRTKCEYNNLENVCCGQLALLLICRTRVISNDGNQSADPRLLLIRGSKGVEHHIA
jgi:hypothetical protein